MAATFIPILIFPILYYFGTAGSHTILYTSYNITRTRSLSLHLAVPHLVH